MEIEPPLAEMADTKQGTHVTAQLNTKLCAAFFALTDQAKGQVSEAHVRINLIQQAFLEDIYPGLRRQQATCRSLEQELEAAKRAWERERQTLRHDLQESESSREQLRESNSKLQQAANLQEGLLLQYLSEEEQLKSEYGKLSEEHGQLSKNLQKLEEEKRGLLQRIQELEMASKGLQNFEKDRKELVERIQTFEMGRKSLQKIEEEKKELVERIQTLETSNRELLHANDELSQKLSLTTERHVEEKEKSIRLTIQQEQLSTQIEDLLSEKMKLQQSLEKICEARSSEARGNSCATAEQIRRWKRMYHNVCRQYNSLVQKGLHQSLSATGQLVKNESNVVQPRAGSANAFRETRSGERAKAADKVELLSRVRTKERPWKNTRVRSPGCALDPHDDFLDTARDLAALNADEDGGIPARLPQDEAIYKNWLGANRGSSKLVSALQKIATARHRKDGQGAINDTCLVASPQGESTQVKNSKAQKPGPTAGSVPRENGMVEDVGKTHLPIVANTEFDTSNEVVPIVADPAVELAEEKQTKLMPGDSHAVKQKQRCQAVDFKYVEPARKKRDREALPGASCKQCTRFYDAIFVGDANGTLLNRCEHYDQVSRHRYRYAPPSTPDGYWNIGFDSDL